MTLVNRLALIFSLVSTVMILLTGVSVAWILYAKTEQSVEQLLASHGRLLVNDHIVYVDNQIRFKRGDQGETITTHLRDVDVSAAIFDENFSLIGSYGIYKNITREPDWNSVARRDYLQAVAIAKTAKYLDQKFPSGSIYDTYTFPVIENSRVVGVIQVAKEAYILNQLTEALWLVVMFIVPLCVVVSWFVVALVTKWSLRPLLFLISYMRQAGAGHLPTPLPVSGHSQDEIVVLSMAFNEMIQRISAGIKRQKTFITNVSHEINTPIAEAVSTLEVVEKQLGGGSWQSVVEKINMTKLRLKSLGETVSSILQLAVADRLGSQSGPIMLRPEVQAAVNRIRYIAERSGVKVLAEVADSHTVVVPRQHLGIILDNLLTNAVKYNRRGGFVKIKCLKNKFGVRVVVSDNGVGLDSDQLQKITRRFWRSEHTAQKTRGYGVGMAIVADICRIYDINIQIESVKDQGTKVILDFK